MCKNSSILKSTLLSISTVVLLSEAAISSPYKANSFEALMDPQCESSVKKLRHWGPKLNGEYKDAQGEKNPDQGSMRYYPGEDDVNNILVPLFDSFYEKLRFDFLADGGFEAQMGNITMCFAAHDEIERLIVERAGLAERKVLLERLNEVGLEKELKKLRAQRAALEDIKGERGYDEGLAAIKEARASIQSCRATFKSKRTYGKEISALNAGIAHVDALIEEQEALRKIQGGESSARHFVHPFLLVQDYIARVTNNTNWLDAMHGRSPGSYSAVVAFHTATAVEQGTLQELFEERWGALSIDGSIFTGLFNAFPANHLSGNNPYPFMGSIIDLCSIQTGEDAFGAAMHATSAYATGFDVMQQCWVNYENANPEDPATRENLLENAMESSRIYKRNLEPALLEAARLVVGNKFSLLSAVEEGDKRGIDVWGKFIGFSLNGDIFDGPCAGDNDFLRNLHISLIKHSRKFNKKRNLTEGQRNIVLKALLEAKGDLERQKRRPITFRFQTVEGQYTAYEEGGESPIGTSVALLAIDNTPKGKKRSTTLVDVHPS